MWELLSKPGKQEILFRELQAFSEFSVLSAPGCYSLTFHFLEGHHEVLNEVQLTLEQHMFELCLSTYMQIFISSKWCLFAFLDVEPWMDGRNREYREMAINYIWIFQ